MDENTRRNLNEPLFYLSYFGLIIVGIYYINRGVVYEKKQKEENENKRKVYFENVREYDQDLLLYNKLNDQYLKDFELCKTQKGLEKYRNGKVSNYLKGATHPDCVPDIYLKGRSEKQFFDLVRDTLPIVYDNLAIRGEFIDSRFYKPDIVLWDEELGIIMDIEIDEPYVSSNKEPIHYLGSDNKRDEFFSSHHWFVIRFAEEQIIKYPDDCIVYILDVYRSILDFRFTNVDFPYKVARWSRYEAEEMAKNNYRTSYSV